ncbi:MAG TPA: hypothetical protein DDZ83_19075 [Nitrospinae bacterium]|nr:hypothetical protein [Nitrospinota bacterium]
MKETEFQEEGIRTLQIDSPAGSVMDHVLVILAGEGPYVLIDAGYPEAMEEVCAWVSRKAGDRLEALLLTHHHHDHLGGAEAIVAATGVPCFAHPVEAELMKERAPALSHVLLRDGETFRAGGIAFEALLTPGHSPGHLAFWWPERGILFGGDNVLMPNSTWVGPPLGNLRVYLESLEKVRALDPRVIFPGHGPPVEDPAGRIDALIRHRADREEQVLDALAGGLDTPGKMAERIYRGLGEKIVRVGASMLTAHLEKLIEEGRVRREGERYLLDG